LVLFAKDDTRLYGQQNIKFCVRTVSVALEWASIKLWWNDTRR